MKIFSIVDQYQTSLFRGLHLRYSWSFGDCWYSRRMSSKSS